MERTASSVAEQSSVNSQLIRHEHSTTYKLESRSAPCSCSSPVHRNAYEHTDWCGCCHISCWSIVLLRGITALIDHDHLTRYDRCHQMVLTWEFTSRRPGLGGPRPQRKSSCHIWLVLRSDHAVKLEHDHQDQDSSVLLGKVDTAHGMVQLSEEQDFIVGMHLSDLQAE